MSFIETLGKLVVGKFGGSLVKGGGLIGILVMLFELLVDNAKKPTTDDDSWNKTSSSIFNIFSDTFKKFGLEMPDFIKSSMRLVDDRQTVAALSADDRERLTTGIAEATPSSLHSQLETRLRSQVAQLQSQSDVISATVPTAAADKFGFTADQASRPLSLEQLDRLYDVNTDGVSELKRSSGVGAISSEKQVASKQARR